MRNAQTISPEERAQFISNLMYQREPMYYRWTWIYSVVSGAATFGILAALFCYAEKMQEQNSLSVSSSLANSLYATTPWLPVLPIFNLVPPIDCDSYTGQVLIFCSATYNLTYSINANIAALSLVNSAIVTLANELQQAHNAAQAVNQMRTLPTISVDFLGTPIDLKLIFAVLFVGAVFLAALTGRQKDKKIHAAHAHRNNSDQFFAGADLQNKVSRVTTFCEISEAYLLNVFRSGANALAGAYCGIVSEISSLKKDLENVSDSKSDTSLCENTLSKTVNALVAILDQREGEKNIYSDSKVADVLTKIFQDKFARNENKSLTTALLQEDWLKQIRVFFAERSADSHRHTRIFSCLEVNLQAWVVDMLASSEQAADRTLANTLLNSLKRNHSGIFNRCRFDAHKKVMERLETARAVPELVTVGVSAANMK